MIEEMVVVIGMLCQIKNPKIKHNIKIECIDHYVNCLDKKPIEKCKLEYKKEII